MKCSSRQRLTVPSWRRTRGAAIAASLFAANLFVIAHAGAQEPAKEETESVALWSIKNVTISKMIGMQDISALYEENFGTQRMTLRPLNGRQFVVARSTLTALVPDPMATAKLDALRKKGAFALQPEDRKKAKAVGCRLFNMQDLTLVDSAGNRYPAAWPIDQQGSSLIVGGGNLTMTFGTPAPPWVSTLRTNNSFDGLITVGKEADVSFLFSVPRNVKTAGLQLRHREESGPAPAKAAAKAPENETPATDAEGQAAEKLKRAKEVVGRSPFLAKIRLEEMIRDFPKTKAASEARELLKIVQKKLDKK